MENNTIQTLKELELRLMRDHKELDRLELAAYGVTLPELARLVIKFVRGEESKSG